MRWMIPMLLVLPAAALGTEPEAAPARVDGALCLSDGQSLEGEQVDTKDGFRTVRIDEAHVRVPQDSLGESCTELRPASDREAASVKTVILSDGQRLYGTPRPAAAATQIELLDYQRVYVPEHLVVDVKRLQSDDPQMDPLRRARNSHTRRQVLGVAANIGLGLVGAALVGGAVYVGWQARPQVPPPPSAR